MKTDIIDLGIAVNSSTETVGGITMPRVRGIEAIDPVYFEIEDKPLMDLRQRTIILATAIQNMAGGYLHQYFSEFRNDVTTPFVYGTDSSDIATTDFPSTATAKGYIQTTLGDMAKNTTDLNLTLQYVMSTSSAAKFVKLNVVYKLIESGDDILSGTTIQTVSSEYAVPATQNELSEINIVVPAATLALLTSVVHAHLVVSVERVNFGMTGTNHSGTFKTLGLTIWQI